MVTVDVRNKKVVFKDGFKLEYSKLLLAPGSRWACLPCRAPGRAPARVGGLRCQSPSLTLAVSQP